MFAIQFVAQVTGLNPHTIRAWEKRYQILTPLRDENQRRRYSQEDIHKLQALKDLTDKGLIISQLAKLSNKQLQNLHKKYFPYEKSSHPHNQELKQNQKNLEAKLDAQIKVVIPKIINALEEFDLCSISCYLSELKQNCASKCFVFRVILPIMKSINEHIMNEKISVAQEHALSSIIRFQIGHVLYMGLQRENQGSQKNNNLIVLTTPKGELHEFGILLTALLCVHNNIRFYYLGADMRADSLKEIIHQLKPDQLIVGVSSYFLQYSADKLSDYTNQLIRDNSLQCKIVLGGVDKENFSSITQLPSSHIKNIKFIPSMEDMGEYLESI